MEGTYERDGKIIRMHKGSFKLSNVTVELSRGRGAFSVSGYQENGAIIKIRTTVLFINSRLICDDDEFCVLTGRYVKYYAAGFSHIERVSGGDNFLDL